MSDSDVKSLVEGIANVCGPRVARPYSESKRDILCKLICKHIEVSFFDNDVNLSVLIRYSEAIDPSMS